VNAPNPNTRALDAINKAQVLVSSVVEGHAAEVPRLELVGILVKASSWAKSSSAAAHADGADMDYIIPRKTHMERVIQTIREALDKGGYGGRDGLYGLAHSLYLKSPDYLDAVRGVAK
jgi:dihydroorotate dehydrogenase